MRVIILGSSSSNSEAHGTKRKHSYIAPAKRLVKVREFTGWGSSQNLRHNGMIAMHFPYLLELSFHYGFRHRGTQLLLPNVFYPLERYTQSLAMSAMNQTLMNLVL